MPRNGITKLPSPKKVKDHADPLLIGDDGRQWFETKQKSCAEDVTRANLLRAAARDTLADDDAEVLRCLARRLQRSAKGEGIPPTLASHRYLRQHRRRIIRDAYRLVGVGPRPATTVTLIPRGWEFPAGALCLAEPRLLLNRMRTALNRAGAAQAQGYFLGFVDGEYEPTSEVYQLHVHAVVTGEMIDIVDRLRKTRALKSANSNFVETGETVRFRVVMAQKRLTNLPYHIGYQLKSFWLSHAADVGPSGWLVRSERGSRIPNPQHSEVLLWLDRWKLGDISLLVNLRVGCDGLEFTRSI